MAYVEEHGHALSRDGSVVILTRVCPMLPHSYALFKKFLDGGEQELLGLIHGVEPEHDYVDHKEVGSTSSQLQKGRLVGSDAKNLSKCIGGFHNSLGGVVIWGSADPKRQSHSPQSLIPGLQDAGVLQTLFREQISRATVPPVEGIEFGTVLLSSGKSVLLMYVPPRRYGPTRSTLRSLETYYFRAGESFLPVPHDILASMFGQVPPAEIRMLSGPAGNQPHGRAPVTMFAHGSLYLHNPGLVVGEKLYASIRIGFPSDNCAEPYLEGVNDAQVSSVTPGRHTIILRPDRVLPPGCDLHVANIRLNLSSPFTRDLRVSYTVGAGNGPAYRGEHEVSVGCLREWLGKLEHQHLTSGELWAGLFGTFGQ